MYQEKPYSSQNQKGGTSKIEFYLIDNSCIDVIINLLSELNQDRKYSSSDFPKFTSIHYSVEDQKLN